MSHPNSPWHFSASRRPGMAAKAAAFLSSLSTWRVRPLHFALAGIFFFLLAAYALAADVEAACIQQGVGDLAFILVCWIVVCAGFIAGAAWAGTERERRENYERRYAVRDYWRL